MGLVNCLYCGKETPDTAERCVHCGAPNHRLKSGWNQGAQKTFIWFVIALALVAVAAIIFLPR